MTSLRSLQLLSVAYNAMNGTVPGGLSLLTQLTNLELRRNAFSGALPDVSGATALRCVDPATGAMSMRCRAVQCCVSSMHRAQNAGRMAHTPLIPDVSR